MYPTQLNSGRPLLIPSPAPQPVTWTSLAVAKNGQLPFVPVDLPTDAGAGMAKLPDGLDDVAGPLVVRASGYFMLPAPPPPPGMPPMPPQTVPVNVSFVFPVTVSDFYG